MLDWFKKHDVLTKAVSILIALILWIYVVNINDSVKDVRYRSLTPTFVGLAELTTSKNLMVVGDYSVSVEISARRNDILSLNASDIKVEVDVSKVNSAGTYELPYTVTLPSPQYTLKNKYPQKLSVKFDEEDINSVPIKLNTDELAADGYVVDKNGITMNPKELKIFGLQEDVDKISYAQINIVQKGVKSGISGTMEYSFYDVDGNPIKSSSVEADFKTVEVSIPILKTKTVPLALEINGSDAFKKYVDYSIEPATMQVAGEESAIDQLTNITVGAVDISELSARTERGFTITMPDGIINLSGEVSAAADIRLNGLKKKTVKTSLIEVINTYTLPAGFKIRPLTTSLDVDILGTEETLAKVNSNNVRAIADLQSTVLSRGTHPIYVKIVVDGVADTAVANAGSYLIYAEVK